MTEESSPTLPVSGRLLPSKWRAPALDTALAAAAATLALVVAGWGWVTYVDQPLLEAHGFRQTQTALTSYWMMRDGFRLAYETPVVGSPWPIPFEFPLYQWIVAVVAVTTKAAGTSLSTSGRSVSFAFLVASLVPAAMIVRRLGLPSRVWLTFGALFLSSPLYLFWGRTFMIETAATCLMLFALAYGLDVMRRVASWATLVLAFVWTTLALLQKIPTTLTVVAMLGIAWLVLGLRQDDRRRAFAWREWLKPAIAWGLPLAIAIAWNAYADAVKAQNPVAVWWTSWRQMGWNFGTLEQRISMDLWTDVVLFRGLFLNAGAGLGAVVVAAALCRRRQNDSWGIIAGALSAYFSALLVFTNLHLLHDYYQVSCTVFLIAAVAVAIGEWLPHAVPNRRLWPYALLVVMAANFYQFYRYELPFMQLVISPDNHRTLAIAREIDRLAPAGAPLLVYGYDWSSEVAYYTGRKSFTVPGWFPRVAETLTNPERFLGGMTPGAIVVCPTRKGPTPELVDRLLAARDQYAREETRGCSIFFRRADDRRVRQGV
jgi:hypothetical protein